MVRIASQRVLAAGNAHAPQSVIVLTLADAAGLTLPAEAAQALGATLPPLREDVFDFPGWSRLAAARHPVPIAAVIEVLTVAVQRYVFWPVRFCGWQSAPDALERDDVAAERAVFEIGTKRSGMAAAKAAVALAVALVEAREPQEIHAIFDQEMKTFLEATLKYTPYPDALGIAAAATSRGISWSVLLNTTYLRLGSGRFAHILGQAVTTATPVVGHRIASSKRLTNSLLAAAGLPVPAQRIVYKKEAALAAAQEIGFPVVVKPNTGNTGRGVTVGVRDETGLLAAVHRAQAISSEVVVEALISGKEYRLLVVGGRFVAAANRRPAQVCGDGVATVRELVERVNARPERERLLSGPRARRKPLVLDEDALALLGEQGLSPDVVPEAGQTVLLRLQSNISQGGDSIDVTDEVHPLVRGAAEQAAKLLKIDICGVDYLTTDISRSPRETGGGICELNTGPGLSSHTMPAEGKIRDVYGTIVDMLFAEGAPSRCPVVVLLEPDGSARDLCRAIEAAATHAGRRIGVVLPSNGIFPEDELLLPSQRLDNVEAIAWNQEIDGAVVVVSAAEVVQQGLGLQHIDLALVPASGAGTILTRASRALASIVENGVVSADDPEALQKAIKALNLSALDHGAP